MDELRAPIVELQFITELTDAAEVLEVPSNEGAMMVNGNRGDKWIRSTDGLPCSFEICVDSTRDEADIGIQAQYVYFS